MSLLAHAMDSDLPVEAIAMVASPFDFSKVPLVAPLRPIAAVTGGQIGTQLYRVLGGAPAPLVKRGYQLAGIDKYVMKPWTIMSNLGDADLLAQIEAVDAFMGRMHAYPGRTFGQLYHRFFRTNDLANGRLALTDQTIDLADVTVPLLAIAGPRRRDRARRRRATTSATWCPTPRGGAARDGARRAPRRAHRPRRAPTTWKLLDGFLDARRVAAPASVMRCTLPRPMRRGSSFSFCWCRGACWPGPVPPDLPLSRDPDRCAGRRASTSAG